MLLDAAWTKKMSKATPVPTTGAPYMGICAAAVSVLAKRHARRRLQADDGGTESDHVHGHPRGERSNNIRPRRHDVQILRALSELIAETNDAERPKRGKVPPPPIRTG